MGAQYDVLLQRIGRLGWDIFYLKTAIKSLLLKNHQIEVVYKSNVKSQI